MAPSIWEKEGESGLLDNFAFTITRSFFGTNEKYMNGEVFLLNWEGITDSLDVPIMTVWYSFGGGWISKDGGKTIVHESGNPEKYFNKSTQYYRIIRRCVDDFGLAALMDERGDPFHAETWVGLSFQMRSEEQAFNSGAEGDKPKPKTMPVEFLGVVGGEAAASSGGASTAPATETAKEKMARLRAEKDAAGSGELSLRDRVIEVLKAHDDFETAQTTALEIDGVMDDDDLLNELMDADGLFATVKASA